MQVNARLPGHSHVRAWHCSCHTLQAACERSDVDAARWRRCWHHGPRVGHQMLCMLLHIDCKMWPSALSSLSDIPNAIPSHSAPIPCASTAEKQAMVPLSRARLIKLDPRYSLRLLRSLRSFQTLALHALCREAGADSCRITYYLDAGQVLTTAAISL